MKLLKLSIFNLLFYALDMATAIAGMTLGFGLTVKNWPALVGFMLLSRWVVNVARGVYAMNQEGEKP